MRIRNLLAVAFAAALWLPAQFPDFTPPTPLIGAILRNDTAEVKRLLAAGADPNEARFVGATPIFFGLMHNNREIVEAMIAKGADVKATDGGGATTLMWAAFNEIGETVLVEKLLALGVDPNAKNKAGETALTWALRRGHTPVVESLRKAGASDTEMVKQAVEKAIGLMQKSAPEFVKVSGCASCHHQSLPQMAYSAARERGYQVDEKAALHQVKTVVAMFKPLVDKINADQITVPDPAISVSYLLLGLAAEGYAPDSTTQAMARLVARDQRPDGSFIAFPLRPPIESSTVTATALSLRALDVYGKDSREPVKRARQWLETAARPRTTEELAMRLMGLAWGRADAKHLAAASAALLAEQRPDGGWAQLPGLETDAYATGQALVALRLSGQMEAGHPAARRGAAFLLRTQNDDGSWFVRTRSYPVQPLKESGFPHGRHQWISASGTGWAVMALSLMQPPVRHISQVVPPVSGTH